MENTFKVADGQDFKTITNNGKKNVDNNNKNPGNCLVLIVKSKYKFKNKVLCRKEVFT